MIRDAPSASHYNHAINIGQEHATTIYVPNANISATAPSQIDIAATYNRILSPYEAVTATNGIARANSSSMNSSHTAIPTSPVFSMEDKPKIPCPQCAKTFVRASDLERHAKSHAKGMPEFECPAPGCARKGMKGFWRKDKMMDHYRCRHGRRG